MQALIELIVENSTWIPLPLFNIESIFYFRLTILPFDVSMSNVAIAFGETLVLNQDKIFTIV